MGWKASLIKLDMDFLAKSWADMRKITDSRNTVASTCMSPETLRYFVQDEEVKSWVDPPYRAGDPYRVLGIELWGSDWVPPGYVALRYAHNGEKEN